MGATNCPETPRQKMIGMMYLVYTAMLALNVSAEILNGFVTVGDSMEVTNNLLLSKTASSYQMFENAYKNNPAKIQENWDKAQQVRKESKALIDYIDKLKYELIANADALEGGPEAAKQLIKKEGFLGIVHKDEVSKAVNFFLGSGEQDGSVGKAKELKDKIDAYQTKMMNLCDDRFKEQLKKIQIDTKVKHKNAAGQEQNWQMYNFYQGIVVADLVVLNKLRSEIQNAEYDLVNSLYSAISADDFKFDQVVAKVIPKETYIMQGGSYEADVIVAAYDSRSQLTGECAMGTMTPTDSGMIKLKIGAGALGPKKYTGRVFVKTEAGNMPYDFSGEFFVAAPSATISATKMNVMYIGVENPIEVGAPGIKSEDLVVTLTGDPGAQIRKVSTGQYVATVKTQGKRVTVNVAAKFGGQTKKLGSQEFRVKVIPQFTAKVGSYDGGRISAASLAAQGGLRVDVSGFDFPVKYSVASFEMGFSTNTGDAGTNLRATNGSFTPEMISRINKLRKGQRVFIQDIRVKGPDGVKPAANSSILFTIQ